MKCVKMEPKVNFYNNVVFCSSFEDFLNFLEKNGFEWYNPWALKQISMILRKFKNRNSLSKGLSKLPIMVLYIKNSVSSQYKWEIIFPVNMEEFRNELYKLSSNYTRFFFTANGNKLEVYYRG